MKKLFLIALAVLVIGGVMTAPAIAQMGQQQQQQRQATAPQIDRVSELMGKNAVSLQGEMLGKIDDLVVGRNGNISYIILSGDQLGKRNQLIPIPWQAANPQMRQNRVVLNTNKQMLQNAPGFQKNNWSQLDQMEQQVYSYYGAQRGMRQQQMPMQQQQPQTQPRRQMP